MAGDIAINLVVSAVANRLSKVLIEEYAALGGAARQIEWIERELRSMQGLLEQVEQHGYGQQKPELKQWADKLKETAGDAKDVIETFVLKSVKRRRSRGTILYWFDKYKVGKELWNIRKRMRDISQEGINLSTGATVGVSVETQVAAETSSSSPITAVVATAIAKLDQIMSQNLAGSDEVIMEIVEQAKGELGDVHNIVSNLKLIGEIEKIWLEEVRGVCVDTVNVAENFILRKAKWLKMNKLRKVLHLNAGYYAFKKEMKSIRSEIGDALHRRLTYGVGGKDIGMRLGDKQTRSWSSQRSTPVPNLSLQRLITATLAFLIIFVALFYVPQFADSWIMTLLSVSIFHVFDFVGGRVAGHNRLESKMSSTQKKRRKKKGRGREILIQTSFILFFILADLAIIILSNFLPLQAAFFLDLVSPIYEVVVWKVNLYKSIERNLKCTRRHLDLMHVFLRDTAEEETGLNKRQKVWMCQMRLVAQHGHQSIIMGDGNCLSFRRIKFSKDINALLKLILTVLDRKTIYSIADIPLRPSSTQQREITVVEQNTDNSGSPTGGVGEHSAVLSSNQPLTGFKEKVQSIREEKQLMDALFRDVDDMGEKLDGRSRIWVEQMRGIANEVESVLNHEHVTHNQPIHKYWTQRAISKKIDEIRNKIEDASRRRKIYGLLPFQTPADSLPLVQILRRRMQLSLVAKEDDQSSTVVGFEDDIQVLKAQLLSSDDDYDDNNDLRSSITCIVGVRGTGKKTLARLIFDDKDVVDHFECRLWLSLSVPTTSNCNTLELLLEEEIVKQAAHQIMGDRAKVGKYTHEDVFESLASTKYLIVVDDVQTSQVLDTLYKAIPERSKPSSRILLTTRNAATIAQQHRGGTRTFLHRMQLLDDETSWKLFTRNLKVSNISQKPPELIQVAREIVIKCGGLRSEILKMSDLLSDIHEEGWSGVLWQPNQDENSWSETLHTINTNLPIYLRRCLFYFVLFPVQFGIPVRRLFALWVAENVIHHAEEQEDEVPQEEIAERYLTELIDRNMVQIAKRRRNCKVKTCRLPNALRQLWLTKDNDDESRRPQAHADTDSNADPKNSIIRWVADHLNKDDIWHRHIHGDTKYNSAILRTYFKDVHTFISFDDREGSKPGQEIGNFLNRCISSNCFLLLRMLDLEGVFKPKLPISIARLSKLRYLGLRWTYLESLPSSISSLLKLQTLDLKHTYIHILPTSIWKMELRHLILSETFRSRFPPQPKDNTLSDLQTLWGLFVDEETPLKNGFDRLLNIRKLGLACQSMSLHPEAMKTQLQVVADWIVKLEYLETLRLKSRDEEGQPWDLPLKSLKNNINLTDMYLLGSLNSSSVLSQFPLNLVELTLSHSKLADDPMQMLKEFPCLQTLCLLADSYIGKTMVCESESFPQLQVLRFWMLKQLDKWEIKPGALPCLIQLEIRSCPSLTMLPDGLKHVNTLLELMMTNMPMEINAERHKIPPSCQVVQLDSQ